uniref:Uncharacterized protein n=1 Tax=Arion vulgaris TaxID=1028688 RepID=A0A0B6ZYN8_9EUPU
MCKRERRLIFMTQFVVVCIEVQNSLSWHTKIKHLYDPPKMSSKIIKHTNVNMLKTCNLKK